MKMTLAGHFRELRLRVIWSLCVFAAAFGIGLWIAPGAEKFIASPLTDVIGGGKMIMTGVADALSVQFSLSGLIALAISVPFFLYQLWRYVAPALKENEKRAAVLVLALSPVLFAAGIAFAYFALLPMMFRFFASIPEAAELLPDLKKYLSFSVEIFKAFGLAFQFPLVLVLLNRAGVFSRRAALSASRYAVVGIFAAAAVLTPPDIVSQIALAAPMMILFALSLLFMK